MMFKGNANRLLLSQKKVMKSLEARVSVYERRGNYQIYVNKMELDGIGNLYQKLEQLKQKLKRRLFNNEHKKPIPRFPKNRNLNC